MRGIISEKQLSWRGLTILVQYKLVKNITLRIKADNSVQLSVPYGMPQRYLQEFLSEKESWLRSKLALHAEQEKQPHYIMGEIPYDGRHVWLWGEKLSCNFLVVAKAKVQFTFAEGKVNFTVPHELTFTQQAELLKSWYAYQVRCEGTEFINLWQVRMGVRCTGLKVHLMKTRWGSCNVRTGGINLNTLLACWPKECLEYIVVHELTHLLEANHSPRFHALVGKFLPAWRERKQLLEAFAPK